ncbi:DNA helicase II [Oceanibaculum pacificum]|uniref:DNA helicase II n=2 Tax=Oceanibaculum pacificum TaxID=580166 RepID=A0A154WFV6_9PROT|nr:DNA helicase II [Oceanibaculum pacificum]
MMTPADEKILECLKGRKSFLLDAGAGSGKTSSLIRALDHIRGPERKALLRDGQHVACITFTNVAKNEILERTDHDPLFKVTTIHDFLWDAVQSFQKELRESLIVFNSELPTRSRRRVDEADLALAIKDKPTISYSDRGANFLEGRIYHDDLLGVAEVMFRSHPMLAKIVAARYPFIFVDEYQDTHEMVISILMDHLIKVKAPPLIGFFGDKVQSIYPDGVGELSADHQAALVAIKKEENYRCSKTVIDVLNKIRDDIKQVPSGNNVKGAAVYVSLTGTTPEADITQAALNKAKADLGIEIDGELKVLFLTHRLIARKAGYEALWNAYNERGGFAKDSFQAGDDPIASFLIKKVDMVIEAWRAGKVGRAISLLNDRKKPFASRDEKAKVKDALDELLKLADNGSSICDVLRHIEKTGLLPLLDDFHLALAGKFESAEEGSSAAKHQTLVETLMDIPYQEISIYRAVLQSNLPYSTKHGVKGDQFKNVLVILDDTGANWSQYSFGNLLEGTDSSNSRLQRSRNLFYVCCSRAQDTLIVANLGHSDKTKLDALFGVGSVST